MKFPFLVVLLPIWVALVLAVLCREAMFTATPGLSANRPPVLWPECGLRREPGKATLVMVIRNECPCAEASIGELHALLSRQRKTLSAHLLVVCASQSTEQVASLADDVPGLQRLSDPGGALARRFGALTSGQALIYNSQGRLVFVGGLTGGRGHAGSNPGLIRAEEAIRPRTTPLQSWPVFGCPTS